MRAAGFEPEDYTTDPVDIWPENWPAWALFGAISSQWRTTGMGSYIGLDYGPLFTLMDRQGLQGQAWLDMLADIQTIESAALEQIRQDAQT